MPVLLSLGTPLSWKKTLMAEINTWLGFVIDPSVPSVQLAKDKFLLVMKILEDLEEGKVFTSKAIEKGLGRIQWATTCCPATKSLMQPLWAWKQACITSGKPGKVIQALASLLKRLFEESHAQISPFVPTSSWWGASDAGADDFKAHIGGWITNSKTSHRGSRDDGLLACWRNGAETVALFSSLCSLITRATFTPYWMESPGSCRLQLC